MISILKWTSIAAVLALTVLSGSMGWTDQVINGGFEADVEVTGCNVRPTSWQGFATHPKVMVEGSSCPGVPGETAHTGSVWSGEVSSYDTKSGGLYQQVAVCPGETGSFQVYVRTYDNNGTVLHSGSAQARVGYDLTGGTTPTSANVVWTEWAQTNGEWALMQTDQATTTASVVTVFMEYRIVFPFVFNLVFFDEASVTGGWAEDASACAGTPPVVSNVAPAGAQPLPMNDQLINYTIADAESDPAELFAEYRYGDGFESLTLPSYFLFPFGGINGPSNRLGGTGQGAWKLNGHDHHLWWPGIGTPSAENPVAMMVNGAYGHANEPFDLEIRVTFWQRTMDWIKPPEDYEGVGLFVANSDFTDYMFIGAFDDEGTSPAGNAIEGWTIYSIEGHDPAQEQIGPAFNLEPEMPDWDDPQQVEEKNFSVTFRLVRSEGAIDAYHRLRDNPYQHRGQVTPAGTTLGFDQDLVVGMFINEGVVAAIEWFASPYKPCTGGPGGDGTTGLTTSPAGVNHTFDWAIGTDLGQMSGGLLGGGVVGLTAQLRMTGIDMHGSGEPAYSAWIGIESGADPPATPTPIPDTPTPTPPVGECTFHTADATGDWQIDFNLALLIIQRFNLGGEYSCGDQADGYQPGPGDRTCEPHDTDYNSNWEFEFMEMLRFIQFFNMGYHCTDDPSSPDGYAPGPPPDQRAF